MGQSIFENDTSLSVSKMAEDEIAALYGESVSQAFKDGDSFAMEAINALLPAVTAGADAFSQKDFAVVKFPPGVTWNDLCVRKSDGWNLLSNFKDGKFNELAAVKKAGLQPAAAANIALQGAAMVVGQAYMAEISDQLKSIESGISDIQRYLELEQRAKVENAYQMLLRDYVERFDDNSSSSEKRQVALAKLADIRQIAGESWYLQLGLLRDHRARLSSSPKLKAKELDETAADVRGVESAARAALVLLLLAKQTTMRYEGDFSSPRIGKERSEITEMLDEWETVHKGVYGILRTRALLLGESPFDNSKAAARREESLLRYAELDPVNRAGLEHDRRLVSMDFVYNHSRAIVIDRDEIRLVG